MGCVAHTYVGWEDDEGEEHWVTIEVGVPPDATATWIRDRALAVLGMMFQDGTSEATETLDEASVIEVDITDIFCY